MVDVPVTSVLSAGTAAHDALVPKYLYRQDMSKRSLGLTAWLPDAVAATLPELLPGFVVGRFFLPGSEIAAPSRFRFNLADGGSYDIVAGGGELRMEDSTPDTADVTFSCSASTFSLLTYGRLTVEGAVSSGDMTVEGDKELAARF